MILMSDMTMRWLRSKPRASGDDPQTAAAFPRLRVVNPARAGMILVEFMMMVLSSSKPRASGDDPSPWNWPR